MNPQERAFALCQDIGVTTMFTSTNGGYTLPLEISKKIALICVKHTIDSDAVRADKVEHKYWLEVQKEIQLLS